MRHTRFRMAPVAALLVLWFSGDNARGQAVSPERLSAIRTQLSDVKKLLDRLPAQTRRHLSSGAQNTLQLAEHWDEIELALETGPVGTLMQRRFALPVGRAALDDVIPVSNPATDFLFSILGGFTQSETSTAWCGNNLVVGFNDSGSLLESILFGPGGSSFTGSGFSTDGGFTFRDTGFINPGTFPQLAGDPTVNCIDSSTFYYTQLLYIPSPGGGYRPTVGLSISTDGGMSWASPIRVVDTTFADSFLDKPWSTVDPSSKEIFVTYTEFNYLGPCFSWVGIELVHSADGGANWSTPIEIDHGCGIGFASTYLVQGSQVAIDSKGAVYVAYEAFTTATPTREMRIAKSTDHGMSFLPFVKIDNITPAGDGVSIQGLIRNNEFPTLAIDRSGTASDGTVYVAWNDGRTMTVRDAGAPNGVYGYSDILLSRSTDGGKTWSGPIRVNSNPIALPNGHAIDRFQPAAAVDKDGRLAVCWYGRGRDAMNYNVSRACGVSLDRGATWSVKPATSSSWPPIHATDAFVDAYYLGDYDQLSSDFTKSNSGFAGAFGAVTTSGVFVPNQDVFLKRIP